MAIPMPVSERKRKRGREGNVDHRSLIRLCNCFADVASVGIAMQQSGVARSQIFLLQKVGSGLPMGYNDTMQQFQDILTTQQASTRTLAACARVFWPELTLLQLESSAAPTSRTGIVSNPTNLLSQKPPSS